MVSACAFAVGAPAAHAQSAVEGVTVTAGATSAPEVAPTVTPLDVIQPTSVITSHFIENNVPASGNYEDIIKLTPGVATVGPNGPGLMESQGVSIRGFQDGQFNVTLDGVPWGDSNDFTHHTTSYFTAHDLGAVSVDRGPGDASTIGQATFGGTVALRTKDPLPQQTEEIDASLGSYNTRVLGAEFDTGALGFANGGAGIIDFQHLDSDGRLSNMGQERNNVFTKFVAPVSDNTKVTFVGMYNQIHQNVGLGATADQITHLGYNYGLSNNPQSQAYYGYNYDRIQTDQVSLNVTSKFANGLTLDNTVYTYSYFHRGLNGEDPNGETPNGTVYGPNNVPGQRLTNDYTSVGDTLRLSKDMSFGVLKAGVWVDHQTNSRELFEIDFSHNSALNPVGPASIDHLQYNTLNTVQPYLEFDWKPLPGLTVTPGIKYDYFNRSINAPVNQNTLQPLNYDHTYSAPLPSVSAHYSIAPNWTVYAQVAKGFLAPNINVLYTTDPTQSHLNPQQTWNYQAGTSWQSGRLTLSGDVYYIDFQNMIGHRNVGAVTVFYNQGGVIYKGVEFDGAFVLGAGFSLYGNGSLNSALDKTTGQWIPDAPKETAAGGVIYQRSGFDASLLAKYVGPQYGDTGETQPINAYDTADLAVSYTFNQNRGSGPKIKVTAMVDNLFDTHGINALAGYTAAAGTPLYWTIPGRNYAVKLSAAF